jgi:hypothetical protein
MDLSTAPPMLMEDDADRGRNGGSGRTSRVA